MRKFLLAFVILILGFTAMAYSQAKVGTAGAVFLQYSPSARANGMGEAGVALTSLNSPYYNPALIASPANPYRFSTSFWPVKNKIFNDAYKFGSCNVIYSLPKGALGLGENHTISFGYFRTSFKSKPIPVTTYEYPDGTGEFITLSNYNHNLALAYGNKGILDVSAGVSLKLIGQTYDEESSNTQAIDFGLLIGKNLEIESLDNSIFHGSRLYLIPAFGLSNSNIGSDIEYVDQTWPLWQISRFGFSTKIGLAIEYIDETIDILSITAAYENENQNRDVDYDYKRKKYGIEFGFYEAVYFRVGKILHDWEDDVNTIGFSVRTDRLLKPIFGNIRQFRLYSILPLEFSYSKQDYKGWYINEDRELYKLTLTIY